MASTKRIALVISLICALIFFIFIMIFTYQPPSDSILGPLFEAFMGHHLELMIFMGIFGVLVGAAVFYLMSDKVEQKGLEAKAVRDLLLKFLGREDKLVVKELLSRNGRIYQAELAHLPNMTRLKAHRIVGKLEAMGVVEIKPMGKMRSVELKEELKGALLEK
jgi:hypothetical protein